MVANTHKTQYNSTAARRDSDDTAGRDTNKPLPAYRQFWPWFLFILPAIAVIASLATLMIAQDMGKDGFLDGTTKLGRVVIAGPSQPGNTHATTGESTP
jgi:hypothetical protein